MRRLTLAALLFASACGRDSRPTFSDPAQPVEVRAGREFELALKSNQSTGYQWVLVDSAALGPLQLVSKDYAVPREYRDRNGAGGTESWVFRAPSAGSGVISLAYKRPWETIPPAESARFQVTVR
ncbi:MAG: protease inhibitor I42 family protein [Longimicrobiaceae bacterium]